MERPKYYIGRTVIIYILTLLTGTFFSSIILTNISPIGTSTTLFEDVMSYFMVGLVITFLLCIPILFILSFGFTYIYKNHENDKSTWRKLIILSSTCVFIPLILFAIYTYLETMSHRDLLNWIPILLTYAFSGLFYILFVSRFYDKRNPPMRGSNHIPLLKDVLDSGWDK